jgi:translocation protein SEC62
VSRRFRVYYLGNNLLTPYTVKRALRALQSPAYAKARSKNPLLPEVTDRASLENAFKLLPLSLLALRVSKVDPNEGHEGHNHAPPPKTKRIKGLWTVKIEQQQDCKEELHYVWLYEGSQIKTKLYAAGALLVIFAIVLFPLWPMKMRLGVWYLSMGLLGLIGLFFAMSIVRLIIWGITAIALPVPWLLFPNLFEDGQLLVQLSRISCTPSPFLFPFPSHFSALYTC